MFHALARPHPWWIGMVLWGVVTFTASSFSVAAPSAPAFEIPHLDKVLHFCWFTVGGFILANAILFRKSVAAPISPIWWKVVIPVLLMSILGALDEYRQSFTPGRNGNDFGDWVADTLGGLCGVLLANAAHRIKWLRGFH